MTPALALAAVAAGLLTGPATAWGPPDQELPFTCGEAWTGTTRSTHRPSPWAIDFNRPEDLGRLVLASAGGVVSRVEDTGSTSYGKWIRIQHPDDHSTVYAHLKAQWVVVGQFVDQGAPIGRVGATGGASGAHLHYEQRLGSQVRPATFHDQAFAYGSTVSSQNCTDVPLSGDWDGNRSDDVAVYRHGPGGLFVLSFPGSSPTVVRLGRSTDLPVSGDWDGDGVTDVGVRRQATRVFLLRAEDATVTRLQFGYIRDLPVTGDWNGDGRTDVGIWRPATLRFHLRRPDGTEKVVPFGGAGSQPVTGDWNGDGRTDVGVFDTASATFRLRTASAAGVVVTYVPLGVSTDLPVTGDWDGNGVTDVGTWRPDTATFTLRIGSSTTTGSTTQAQLRTLVFGRPR